MTRAFKFTLSTRMAHCVTASLAQAAAPQDGIVSFPAARLNWTELPNAGGIKYANVRGDLAGKGSYEAFMIFPAGKRTTRFITTPRRYLPWS